MQLLFLLIGIVPQAVAGLPRGVQDGQESYCWEDSARYRPPDFEAYFPDDAAGATELATFWEMGDRESCDVDTAVSTIRRGLRNYQGSTAPLLQWLGNRYIRNQGCAYPEAIELMYHASDRQGSTFGAADTRPAAVHFGLTVVRPMTPAILRTLMAIAVDEDAPEILSRIAWGVAHQRDAALEFLEPYLESPAQRLRTKAAIVAKIVRREILAFDWAEGEALAAVSKKYRTSLSDILSMLVNGDSEERYLLLAFIEQESALLIMDDGHLAAFATCAEDPSPAVRRIVARMVGSRWIASAQEIHPEAIEIEMALSADADPHVRYNAVYFGLSLLPNKNERVVRRLLELAFDDCPAELYDRIAWGLQTQRSFARAVLDDYVSGRDVDKAAAARMVYADMGGRVWTP